MDQASIGGLVVAPASGASTIEAGRASARPRSRGRRFVALTATIWLTLVVLRWEVIALPPYYDYALGIWREADYLAQHDFNYVALRAATHGLDPHGGPRSYVTCVMPTIIALLMASCPSPQQVVIIAHLLVFLFASAALAILYDLLRRTCAPGLAALMVAALATTPVFAVQVDMVGSEMLLILAVVGCIWLNARLRFHAAALLSLAAFLAKSTGAIVTVANIVLLCLLALYAWWTDRPHGTRWARAFALPAISNGLVLLTEIGIGSWAGSLVLQLREGLMLRTALLFAPDVVFLALVTAAATVLAVFNLATTRGTKSAPDAEGLPSAAFVTYLAILSGGLVLGYTRVAFVPRYLALLVPLLYLLLANAWRLATPTRSTATLSVTGNPVLALLLGAAMAFNALNWNGALLPDMLVGMRWMYGTDGSLGSREGGIERSHDYLIDQRENIAAIKALERELAKSGDRPPAVIAGHPLCAFLAYPSLGIVAKPIYGYSINGFSDSVPQFRETRELLKDMPDDVLALRTSNYHYSEKCATFHVPGPDAGDEILFSAPGSPVLLYRKRWTAQQIAAGEKRDWYNRNAWPTLKRDAPEAIEIRRLLLADQLEAAREKIIATIARSPFDPINQSYWALLEVLREWPGKPSDYEPLRMSTSTRAEETRASDARTMNRRRDDKRL